MREAELPPLSAPHSSAPPHGSLDKSLLLSYSFSFFFFFYLPTQWDTRGPLLPQTISYWVCLGLGHTSLIFISTLSTCHKAWSVLWWASRFCMYQALVASPPAGQALSLRSTPMWGCSGVHPRPGAGHFGYPEAQPFLSPAPCRWVGGEGGMEISWEWPQ